MDILEEPDVTPNVSVNLENESRIYLVCVDLWVFVLCTSYFVGGG